MYVCMYAGTQRDFSIISIFSKVKIYERKVRIEKEIIQEKNATILLFFNSVMSLIFFCSSLYIVFHKMCVSAII